MTKRVDLVNFTIRIQKALKKNTYLKHCFSLSLLTKKKLLRRLQPIVSHGEENNCLQTTKTECQTFLFLLLPANDTKGRSAETTLLS